MDTSTVADRADTLGRRVVPRHFRSLAEKLKIIAEVRASGASVAAVARRHGVNANLIFAWMRLEEQGLLGERTRRAPTRLLAVTVRPEPVAPSESLAAAPPVGHLEIALAEGLSVRVFGAVPSERIEQVLRLLRR